MVKVIVGDYLEDGTFDGEEIGFEGREVHFSEGVEDSVDPHDQFGYTLRLYECPDGYRAMVTFKWPGVGGFLIPACWGLGIRHVYRV